MKALDQLRRVLTDPVRVEVHADVKSKFSGPLDPLLGGLIEGVIGITDIHRMRPSAHHSPNQRPAWIQLVG